MQYNLSGKTMGHKLSHPKLIRLGGVGWVATMVILCQVAPAVQSVKTCETGLA